MRLGRRCVHSAWTSASWSPVQCIAGKGCPRDSTSAAVGPSYMSMNSFWTAIDSTARAFILARVVSAHSTACAHLRVPSPLNLHGSAAAQKTMSLRTQILLWDILVHLQEKRSAALTLFKQLLLQTLGHLKVYGGGPRDCILYLAFLLLIYSFTSSEAVLCCFICAPMAPGTD